MTYFFLLEKLLDWHIIFCQDNLFFVLMILNRYAYPLYIVGLMMIAIWLLEEGYGFGR